MRKILTGSIFGSALAMVVWPTIAFTQELGAATGGPVSYAGQAIDNVLQPGNTSPQASALQASPIDVPPSNLGAFSIVILPSPGLAANPSALAAFNRAADLWEARISDPIVITISAGLDALPAGVIGSTSSAILQAGYSTIRDAMVADAADEADDAIATSLPTAAAFSALIPGGRSLDTDIVASKANLKALGFTGLDAIFGVIDADITFSTSFSFDYDNSDGVGAGMLDFETVAAHEIGHALGFISIVDTVDAGLTVIPPFPLDLFRFSNNVAGEDPATTGEFTSFPRNLIPGEDTVTDEIANERRMSTGLSGGDGNQASHWKADDLTGEFIGLMDPTLSSGQFYGPQESDFRAMDLIGYEVAPIPEPGASALLVGTLVLIAGRRRRMSI